MNLKRNFLIIVLLASSSVISTLTAASKKNEAAEWLNSGKACLHTNPVRARQLLEKAAAQVHDPVVQAQSWLALAELYNRNEGPFKNEEKAIHCLELAAYQTYDRQTSSAALRLLEEITQAKRAAMEAQRPAQEKDVVQWFNEALMYLEGRGVSKDGMKACGLLEKVAKQTIDEKLRIEASFRLGELYWEDKEIRSNHAKARDYFESVAAQEKNLDLKIKAMLNVVFVYLFAENSVSDRGKARHYLTTLANQSYSNKYKEVAQEILKSFDLFERNVL